MAFYKELDRSKDEVRMLTIVDPPENCAPERTKFVHCRLEHVRLDDFTEEFRDFRQEINPENQALDILLQEWIRYCDRGLGVGDTIDSTHARFRLPAWRHIMHYGSLEERVEQWDELMEAIGIDVAACPQIPRERREFGLGYTGLRSVRVLVKDRSFSIRPRFRWGEFEAVSYCWESDVRDQMIIIDDVPFEVPTNLEALLQKLRTLPDGQSGMKFWVDALCINQQDTSERNHQVQLMKSIYSNAFSVIVWLGGGTDDSIRAINFIASIARFTLEKNTKTRPYHLKLEQEKLRQLFSELPWKQLLNFLNRAYWRRLWIIQESALNHHMTVFLCGDRQLPRSMISRACYFCQHNIRLIDHLVSPTLKIETTSPARMYGSIWPTLYHVNKLLETRDRNEIDVVLDLSRKANVTDARDKVYGILGILPGILSSAILPDYQASNYVEKVYFQFAYQILLRYGRLDSILSWCCFDPDNTMPSWIPNWSTKFLRNHVQWLKRRSTSKSLPGQWSTSQQGRVLIVKGIILDHIKSTGSSEAQKLPFRSQQSRQDNDLEKDSNCQHRYGDTNGLASALRRTLVMHHPDTSHHLNSVLDIYWIDFDWDEVDSERALKRMKLITEDLCWESFDRFRQTNANFSIFGHRFRDFFPNMPEPEISRTIVFEAQPGLGSNMLISVLALIKRKLITTRTGYLGLAPEEVQKDDVIAILYGCNFPVVLRPHGDAYLYIGECYIDGIMEGEIIDAKERGEPYEEVEISLC